MAGAPHLESAMRSSANVPALLQVVQRADSGSSSARFEVEGIVPELPAAEPTHSIPETSTAAPSIGQPDRSLVAPGLLPAPSAVCHVTDSHTSFPVVSAPPSATQSVPAISSRLRALHRKVRQKMTEISKWTHLLEDFPDMAETVNVQIQRTQDEIFGLHDGIREETARLRG